VCLSFRSRRVRTGRVAASPAQDLKEKLAAKEAAANNAKALRWYTWLEKTELSLKGEVKNTKVDSCRDGPDGQVQKTPVVEPPPPEKKRNLKGKIVAKKTGEMKMQVVMNAGTASLSQAGPGAVALKFPGYEKAGDALTLTLIQRSRPSGRSTWRRGSRNPTSQ
jgi:hypothetical protein